MKKSIACKDILSINSDDPDILDLQSQCKFDSELVDITLGKEESELSPESVASTTRNTFIRVIEGVIGALIIAAALLLVDPIKALIEYFIVGAEPWVSSLITFAVLILFAVLISILLVIFQRRTESKNK